MILALAVSAFVGSQWVKTEIASRQQHSAPPIVEKHVISSSYEERLGPTPEVGFIVDRARALHVSDAQLASLKALASEWRKLYGSKIAQANEAAAKTGAYLANAKGGSRTPVAQVQSAAAPVIALSGEISSARRGYWNRAVSILKPEQVKPLQTMRENEWAAKTKAIRR